MEFQEIVSVLLIQAILWNTGEGYTVSASSSKRGSFNKGETFTLRCRGTSTAAENLTPLFLKTRVEIQTYSGAAIAKDPNIYPYVLSSAATIDAKVMQVVSGRYTATGSHSDTEFDYTYTISNLDEMDSGNYSCGVKHGQNQDIDKAQDIPVLVLVAIKNMEIVYKMAGENNTALSSKLGDNDGMLTFQTEDPAGQLACMVQSSTSVPYDCKMMLIDHQNKATDVTSEFSTKFPDTKINLHEFYITVDDKDYFLSKAPTTGNPARFGWEDSGKNLTCSCKSTGLDEVKEVSTILDIQYPPRSPICIPGDPPPTGPLGTRNFTLVCYTQSNPESSVTWMANGAALRAGINVRIWNEGNYIVSAMVIDELQESDFANYTFTATNSVGSASTPDGTSEYKWQIKKGIEAYFASTDPSNYPWGQGGNNETDGASSTFVSTVALFVMAVTALFI